MTANELVDFLAKRLPVLPREKLRPLAEAVVDLCGEARAEEREACAKLADKIAAAPPANDHRHIDWQSGYQDGGMEIAAAIRERHK